MWTDSHLTLHRRNRLFINVTSMVDVLFILLIFFAVSTTFGQTSALDLDLPAARSGSSAQTVKAHEVTVLEKGALALDGVRMDRDQLIEKIRQWTAPEKAKPVILKADTNAFYGDVIRILDELRQAGVLKVQALTRRE